MKTNLKVKHIIEMIEMFEDRIIDGSIMDPSNSFLAFIIENDNLKANCFKEVYGFDLYDPDIETLIFQGKFFNETDYKLPTINDFIEMVNRHNLLEYNIVLEYEDEDGNKNHHFVKDSGNTKVYQVGNYMYIVLIPRIKDYSEKDLEYKNIIQRIGGITS